MIARTDWTTADDIKRQLSELWSRGKVLQAQLVEPPLFPLALRFRKPDARALTERFEDVRQWIKALSAESKETRGFGYDLQWTEINHRQLGRNRVPVGVVVATESDVLKLIGKVREAETFRTLSNATLSRLPGLGEWLASRPLLALEHACDWDKILDLVDWFCRNPRAGLYVRQIDVRGVHTKFVENRKGLIGDLLDVVLTPEAIDARFAGARGFEQRYGLRIKPSLIRMRILDDGLTLQGVTDISLPVSELARLDLPVKRVFVTENEINGLAFPPVAGAIVVFGLGYGISVLSDIGWMRELPIHYWGDIDTHGFAMLDRLRAAFPGVQSFLMDRETFLAHRELWVVEDDPVTVALAHLTPQEAALYDDLRQDRLGERVRLEQERTSFGWLERVLKGLTS